ncbi:MAG: hypothetical protein A2931_01255 [Candidatus Niyogibacteria bacterium RIFCSPLOWO2_01_FULL_45_48]|uniref:Addiction module toxin RelE n=2 Tax=Candidatus Niyogiibacteriota TaxID=1817912 RepID=A0A1G2EY60_9BACT|nr:MAG: hypothetical protein A2835_01485 [Candidatus Niyogibacteria bacterium RIFCSPHIGHO2_01_FULL_45_28]OGZ29681.1 MAG: hypothetical protein A2931_01255 [Candidatus Niyogibacteria bacterium RIFCSPLOWO2_01_FULL_45_48]OGZ30452.1 MAG: hypothetical protein A3J00_04255 [Candidatus Niyogibacteria bacterium RIFCSPLOWO2_02_FULL_45_13]
MKNFERELKKFSQKEIRRIEFLLRKIIVKNFKGLDLKKLKGLKNIFRLRKGRIRVIFSLEDKKEPRILAIERKSDTTYNL